MFVGSNQPRSKRSFEGRAPIPSNDYYEPTETVKTIFRRTEIKPFKFNNRYINSMLDEMFRGW